MRCLKCKVDLGETYTLCPLCGEKASNDEPLLKGFSVAPYPKNSPVKSMSENKKRCISFDIEKIKAFFNL